MAKDYNEIPNTFFDYDEIKAIRSGDDGSAIILLWLKLFFEAEKCGDDLFVFEFPYIDLDDGCLSAMFDEDVDVVKKAFEVFSVFDIAKRFSRKIELRAFWRERRGMGRQRNCSKWRREVLKRDGYRCRLCGSKNDLQAHHILPWRFVVWDKEKLGDKNNGITLCRKCHLFVHDGCWKNVCDDLTNEELKKMVMDRG